VFGPKNEHPAGTVEQFDEIERHWVTDNCFYDFDRHPDPSLIPGPRVKQILRCKPPPSGGTDMFKKMRPGYLTSPPAAPDKRH
jgi:hypothetical protein